MGIAKRIFMAHDKSGVKLGEFTGNCYRTAALKAASKNCKDVDEGSPIELHMRETGTRVVKVYNGYTKKLDTPQIVKRGDKEVVYEKKPAVKFTKKVYDYDRIGAE